MFKCAHGHIETCTNRKKSGKIVEFSFPNLIFQLYLTNQRGVNTLQIKGGILKINIFYVFVLYVLALAIACIMSDFIEDLLLTLRIAILHQVTSFLA